MIKLTKIDKNLIKNRHWTSEHDKSIGYISPHLL